MSYCRFSSDDWRCDLCCYEDVSGGFTTHVACNRIIGDVPHVEWPPADYKTYAEQNAQQMAFLDNAKREPIGLPHDGESFNDPDLESFLERLLMLKEVGYHVPDYVIEAVRQEITGGACCSCGVQPCQNIIEEECKLDK